MSDPSVYIFNDNEELSAQLREKLVIEAGFSIIIEAGFQSGLDRLREGGFNVVIVNFDLEYADKSELIREIRKIDPDLAVIAYAQYDTERFRQELVSLGVYDYLLKPLNDERLFFLVKNAAELSTVAAARRKLAQGLSEQNYSLQKQNTLLARRIEESTQNLSRLYEDLRATYLRTVKSLAQAIDARDHYTHSHSQNVSRYATLIASELGFSAKDMQTIGEACELHDVGKIGIQDSLLLKPSSLTPDEWELMKRHPLTGAQILEPLTFLHGVIDLIRQHHEHFNGSGYPDGLKGDEIHLGARILHLADAYDAMTSARSYRQKPFTKEEAILEIRNNSGTQFDPKVVEAFMKVVDKF